MKCFAAVFSALAIAATGFVLPSRPKQGAISPPEPIAISIDDLALPINNRSEYQPTKIPKKVLELNGKRVRIIGQMALSWDQGPITEFVFNGDTKHNTRDYSEALDRLPLQNVIPVTMRKGTKTRSTHEPIELTGRLEIDVKRVGNQVLFLYKISDATVRAGEREEGFHPSMKLIPIFTC